MRRELSASRSRRGYTLLEVVATLGTSAILVAGLSSTLYMSTQALMPDVAASAQSSRTSLALSQVASDLRLALSLTERTAHAVTLTTPDRTGDSVAETIRYAWSGTPGDPLLYQFNGGAAVTLVPDVQQFNVAALMRPIAATSCILPGTVVVYAPVAKAKLDPAATSINIATPTGLVPGNLMIAVVALAGSDASSMQGEAGWTRIFSLSDASNAVTTAVWWKLASASEAANHMFAWTDPHKAYGWIMRFGGVEPSAPINASASTAGSSASSAPQCPSVTTTVANCMIVRIGGFYGGDIQAVDNSGMSNNTTITADQSDATASKATGAAAYAMKASAGGAGTADFGLSGSNNYVTFTLAIAPDDGL